MQKVFFQYVLVGVFADRLEHRRFPLFLAFAVCGLAINTSVTAPTATLIGVIPRSRKSSGSE